MVAAKLLLAVSALSSFAAAQSANGTLTIDPNSVPAAERSSWCLGQRNTCTQVCGGPGQTKANDCNPTLLNSACTCVNGTTLDLADYQQSLAAQVCRVWVSQCVTAHPNDLEGQSECLSTKCGNQTVSDSTDSSSSSSSSAAAPSATAASTSQQQSSTPSVTGAAASATSSTATGAATALAFAKNYGTPVLAAGMMAVFGLAL